MTQINVPGAYVPAHTLSFGALGSDASFVTPTAPLPAAIPQQTIVAANAVTLAAGASTTPVGIAVSNGYLLKIVVNGTSPSIQLMELDAFTGLYVANELPAITASGKAQINVTAGAGGSAICLKNTSSSNSVTVSAVLVS